MPPNKVVHQILTGRKRKAQNTGASANASAGDKEKKSNKSDSEDSPMDSLSRSFPPQFFSRNSESNKNQKQQPQELSNRKQHWLRNHYRQHYLRARKRKRQGESSTSGNRIKFSGCDFDVNGNASDSRNVDHEQLRRFENIVATRQGRSQRSRASESYSKAVPLASKKYSDAFANSIVRTFLEQRFDKRFTSTHTLSSFPFSPFDDPMLFPVLLLGVSALCPVIEWHDRKREETAFSQSSIVRDLVLWMNDRQELRTGHTYRTVLQDHVDDLNQLTEFQESVEDSHQTSLRLLSRQCEEEQQRNHNKLHFDSNRTATSQTKGVSRRRGLYERNKIPKEFINTYQSTDAFDDLSDQLRQKDQKHDRTKQQKYQQHLEKGDFAIESQLKVNQSSIRSKQDNESHLLEEHTAVPTPTKSTGFEINEGMIGENMLCMSRKLPTTVQIASVPLTTLPSSQISDDIEQRSNINSQFENWSGILTSSNTGMTEKMKQPITKPSRPQTKVVREKEQRQHRITRKAQQPNRPQPNGSGMKIQKRQETKILHAKPTTVVLNRPSLSPPIETERKYSLQDKVPPVANSANVGKETPNAKELGTTDIATNVSITGESKVFNGVFEATRPRVANEIVFQSKPYTENTAGNTNGSNPHYDRPMNSLKEEKCVTDDPACSSSYTHRLASRNSSTATSVKPHIEGENNGGGVEHEDRHWDGTNSDSSLGDMSEVLLTQSQKCLPNSRRVTASPRILSDNKSLMRREQYKHFSKINFSGLDQISGDRKMKDIDLDCPPSRVKRLKRNVSPGQSSVLSSRKSWMSRTSKRSPSFKQTSLTSTAWVSNRRARKFVKNGLSQVIPATKQTDSFSHGAHGKLNATSQKGDFHIQRDYDNVAIRRSGGFEPPTSKIHDIDCSTDDDRNIEQKMPNNEFSNHDSSKLEQNNPAVPNGKKQFLSQAMSVSGNGRSNDVDISSEGAEKVAKNKDAANNNMYEEVVRGKAAREALIGYECEECAAFFDEAVLHGDGAKYYDRDELLRCSRHRARHTPPQTPEDYWDLSFKDEKEEKLRKAG